MKKEKCDFLKIFFLCIFLTFWLSYSIYSIITGSGTQQVNFKEKFCVKAGISCRFNLYPYGYGVVNRATALSDSLKSWKL